LIIPPGVLTFLVIKKKEIKVREEKKEKKKENDFSFHSLFSQAAGGLFLLI
jgi:hypothetical protein